MAICSEHLAVTFFHLGKHWSDAYQQLIFFTSTRPGPDPVVSITLNYNKFFNVSALIDQNQTQTVPEKTLAAAPSVPTPPPPPAEDSIKKFGILNENGTISEEFEVGEFDPGMVNDWVNETQVETEGSSASASKFAIQKFGFCQLSKSGYRPCLDNLDAIRKLESTEKGERFESHCPEEGRGLNCLVPAPKGYRTPIPWPRSRDEMAYCCLKLIGC